MQRKALTWAAASIDPSRGGCWKTTNDPSSRFIGISKDGAGERGRPTSAPLSSRVEPDVARGKVANRGDPAKRGSGRGLADSVLPPEHRSGQRTHLPRGYAELVRAQAQRLRCNAAPSARRETLEGASRRAASVVGDESVRGRACTILFHAETHRPQPSLLRSELSPKPFGASRGGVTSTSARGASAPAPSTGSLVLAKVTVRWPSGE